MADSYSTPILLLIFNRPNCTKKTFDAIRKANPKKLYIAADGPRITKAGEKEICEQTRDIATQIDWDCEVKTLFREVNLGCKVAVSSAITWFFDNEEMGVILEDDCLPSKSFFAFCEELLLKYKDDDRVWHIDGTTSQPGVAGTSYQFSKYCLIWGWASWRRAWKHYDPAIKNFSEFKSKNVIESVWRLPLVRKYWFKNFQQVYNGLVDTWDYQWLYTVWTNNGMSIRPSVNLIKNIGFDQDATHTTTTSDLIMQMKNEEMKFPLQHPAFMLPNAEMDDICSANHFNIRPFAALALNKILNIKNKLFKKS